MKLLLCSLAALSLLAACSSDNPTTPVADGYIARNDFEASLGWSGDPAAVTKAQAHSGQYSIYVDQSREFSLTYEAPLRQVVGFQPRSLEVEAWVFLTDDNSTGELGVQITDPVHNEKQLFGDGINLQEAAKVHNKWVKVSKSISLPDSLNPDQHLKVFLWRSNATSPVYLDDISIKAIE